MEVEVWYNPILVEDEVKHLLKLLTFSNQRRIFFEKKSFLIFISLTLNLCPPIIFDLSLFPSNKSA